MIAHAVSGSPMSFECVEPQGSNAKKILEKVAFDDDCEEIISNWDAESKYVKTLKVCAGLPLALGIAGSSVKLDYVDSKDASFSVTSYCSGLISYWLNELQDANAEYHTGDLKNIVEASLQLCEVSGPSGGRNMDMRRLFRSLRVLEKQQ